MGYTQYYDVVVVACLAALKHRLGDAIEVLSDGNTADWQTGVHLARVILKRKIQNPIKEKVVSNETNYI